MKCFKCNVNMRMIVFSGERNVEKKVLWMRSMADSFLMVGYAGNILLDSDRRPLYTIIL